MKLKHKTDRVAAQPGKSFVGQVFSLLPGQKQRARAGLVKQANDVEQRALA